MVWSPNSAEKSPVYTRFRCRRGRLCFLALPAMQRQICFPSNRVCSPGCPGSQCLNWFHTDRRDLGFFPCPLDDVCMCVSICQQNKCRGSFHKKIKWSKGKLGCMSLRTRGGEGLQSPYALALMVVRLHSKHRSAQLFL